MHARTTALATIAILAATLTACSEPEQGKAERATAAASSPASDSPDGDAAPAADDKPDTELAVGDTFAYSDGLKTKVDSISTITKWGEYDTKPDPDMTPFRVTFTITNGTKKAYDLDGFGYNAEGATTGGQTEFLYVEAGSKQADGRLAAGRSATFTAEYSLAKSDGKEVLFTMSRSDDAWLQSGSFLGDDPNWTGTIK
ncbi:hypothetical protein PV682_27580 [Streptomyces niveiscabiei]|uniref:hypothetical protein n=1 Tax=Streptomyces niveiscabiei TaxID=164115 RepID=UPI0029B37C22|nr:hypothetical protein [Streptomyces niveiscabiei]MDX3385209.1 hypothetical protein [Streptomyces niveiscabiei]